MKEKTADEMFEELGYEKSEYKDCNLEDIFYRKKDRQWRENGEIEICLNNNEKQITIEFMCSSQLPAFIGINEIQAINKKCEELRMDLRREWKEIKGYEGKYIISNYGEIISLPRYKQNKSKLQYVEPKEILRYVNPKNGYVYVQLWNNAKYKNIRLHRLVAQTFIPNLENKPQINHIDGNKQNNKADNLEWCTQSENSKHAYRIGLAKPRGRARGVVR